MTDQIEQDKRRPDTVKNILRRLIQVSMSIIITLIILLVSAGIIKWIYAWIYTLASLLVIITNAFIFPTELISERGRKKENVEKWDKIITGNYYNSLVYTLYNSRIGYPFWMVS